MKLQPMGSDQVVVTVARPDDGGYIASLLGASAADPDVCQRFVARDVEGRRTGCALLGRDDLGYWIDLVSEGGEAAAPLLVKRVVETARLRGAKRLTVRTVYEARDPRIAAWIELGFAQQAEIQRWRVDLDRALAFAQRYCHGFDKPEDARVAGLDPALVTRVAALRRRYLGGDGASIERRLTDPSLPAEPIRGVFLGHSEVERVADAIHPEKVAAALAELVVGPSEIDASALAPFLRRPERIDSETDGRPGYLAAALARTATQQAQLTWLLTNRPWDFAVGLFDGIAQLTRAFGAYTVAGNRKVESVDQEIYHAVVDGAYRFFDLMLGAIVTAVGPNVDILLLSPYGFRPEAIPALGRTPLERTESWYAPRGVAVGAGPGLLQGESLHGVHCWGAAATVLSLLGLPYGEDMAPPWLAALRPNTQVSTVPSWEKITGDAGMHSPQRRRDPQQEYEELHRTAALGYVDAPDEDHAKAMEESLRERRFNIARAMVDRGNRTANAIPVLEGLTAESPQDGRFLAALGQAYFSVGRLDDCRRLVQRASEAGRTGPAMELAIASLDVESGRPAQALRRLEALGAGENAALAALRGRAYARMGRWAEAAKAFEQALKLDRDLGAAYQGLALTHLAQGVPEMAFEMAMEAVDRLPLNPLSHYYLGLALSRLAKWAEAATALANALKVDPHMVAAHRRLAHVFRSQGDFARAADCLWEAKQALRRKQDR